MASPDLLLRVTFLSVIVAVCLCYDVDEEIKELKLLYGDNVMDKPCGGSQCQNREKRFILGSSEYCHDKLGCFPLDGDFKERIVNVDPSSRETINTQFTLYTRSNRNTGQMLTADKSNTLLNSHFDSRRLTKIIIHGFLESTSAIWFKPLNKELLDYGDFNVINVNWGGFHGSKTLYTQATANTRVVAAEIVYLLKTLMKTKSLDPGKVHLIGHSLGSHISGYVGKNMSAAIYRITGLDPAEPYFQGYNTGIRLDPTDAKFVDIIHSDSDSIVEVVKGEGGFGSSELSGHADFFPNGGEDQPNCKNGIVSNVKMEKDLYEGLKRFVACDHDRAIKYFTESINDCAFTGIVCSSWGDYENGKCPNRCDSEDGCNSMGLHAHKPKVSGFKKYYLHTTGEDGHFCAAGYQVKLKIATDSTEFHGAIDITVTGKSGTNGALKKTFQINREKELMQAGARHTYQIGLTTKISDLVALKVVWTRDLSWWRIVTKACGYFGFCTSSIKIDEIVMTSSDGVSHYFCGSGRTFDSGVARYIYSSKSCAAK